MQIGRFASIAGVSARTVRYYEELGLLKPEGHSSGGFRLYGIENVKRIEVINFLRELGLPLEEIRRILLAKAGGAGRRAAVPFLQMVLQEKLNFVDRKLEALGRMKRELEGTLKILSQCEACGHEVVLDAISCSGCSNLTPRDDVPGTFEVILQ
jgi:DNA-binding transcriptional MerR regulator